jgi:hypothetical protein
LVGFEQDASVSELAGRGCARGDQAFEVVSFSVSEDNGIFLLHNGRSIPTGSLSNHIKRHTVLEEEHRREMEELRRRMEE